MLYPEEALEQDKHELSVPPEHWSQLGPPQGYEMHVEGSDIPKFSAHWRYTSVVLEEEHVVTIKRKFKILFSCKRDTIMNVVVGWRENSEMSNCAKEAI